jgi:chromate transport protein ChrA
MLEIIDNLLSRPVYYTIFYATQAIVFTVIMWFMIFRYELFIKAVLSGGLLIAVGTGLAVVALPLLFVSPLLVPVAILIGGVLPLWFVFR